MRINGYLNINSKGAVRYTKSRTNLRWDEIAMQVTMDIPDELFKRPILSAKIEVSKDIIPKPQPMELILNTKELIEQSTGVKIEFQVVPYDEGKDGDA